MLFWNLIMVGKLYFHLRSAFQLLMELKQDIKLSSKDMGNNFVLATQVSKSCYLAFASTHDDGNDDVPRIISHISFCISSKSFIII